MEWYVNLDVDNPNTTLPIESTLTYTCSTNLPDAYPLWEIDSQPYQSTDLPYGFEANGYNLTFSVHKNITTVQCSFLTFIGGILVEIYSNTSTVYAVTPG